MTTSLVIAPQWIGDAVMTEPLLRRLHARNETLTVAALPWVAPVYRHMPHVHQVLELPFVHGELQLRERYNLARQLRGQFSAAYVCPNSFKSALVPWLAGIKRRIGYLGESRRWLLTQRVPNPPTGHHPPPMVDFYMALAGAAIDTEPADVRPRLQPNMPLVTSTLSSLRLQPQGYYVFAPGAEYGPAKRWPAHHFAVLAGQLTLPVLLLGSDKDAQACTEIARIANAVRPGQCTNLAGRTSLDQALAIISATESLVSNDSGLMHVAAAFGVPQIALFGSSSPLHTPPLNPQAQVIWLKNDPGYQPALTCAPCFERECPLDHTRCLVDIQPSRVLSLL